MRIVICALSTITDDTRAGRKHFFSAKLIAQFDERLDHRLKSVRAAASAIAGKANIHFSSLLKVCEAELILQIMN